MRKYHHSLQSSTWHQSRFVRRRRRPPFFLGEDRAGCASKSAIHPRRSCGQTPCHALSRAALVPCQSQRVKAARRSSITGSSPNLSQQPRCHLLNTFQALVFVFGKLFCQPLCFSSPFALGFLFVIRNGFFWTVFSLSGTPTITTAKLNWKNYLPWSASVELWFLDQGYHDHLEKGFDSVPNEKKT